MRFAVSILLSSSLLALASGCTFIVWRDASAAAPCVDDADCPAGEVCVDEACDVVDDGVVPPEGTRVDVVGGEVLGPDGVVLRIPPGALNGPQTFAIRRVTSTLPRDNFTSDGPFFVIEPTVSFDALATITLPGDGPDAFLRRADAGAAWQPLDAVGSDDDDDTFELPLSGIVARGTELP